MNTFGFTAIINKYSYLNCELLKGYKQIVTDCHVCVSHPNSKFPEDKLCAENERYILLLDGVILNKRKLMDENSCSDWFGYLIQLYESKGDVFFNVLRGSFCGILIDKLSQRTLLFTDHIGSKFLYYSQCGVTLFCSTLISYLYQLRHENQMHCSLSEQGAVMMLSYGYMLENYTLCEEIKKVQPGCYIIFEKGIVTEHRYCMLDNTPDYSITESDAIELYDQEFRRAVALEFDKDKESGYNQHLVALSGGLDCRMTSWVAHEMGYTNQLNLTFSQSEYWDEIIPKQIAADLCHEWIFKALDNGLWLYNLDNVLEVTGGNVLYYGQAHSMSLMKYLDFKNMGSGICHSGQLGDVILGSEMKNSNQQFNLGMRAYSTKYLDYLQGCKLCDYPNMEIGLFYSRFFNGTNNGQLITMLNMETVSPHSDWDAMNAIMKVPSQMRYSHNLYKKWIVNKYPKAADYVWESIGTKITSPTLTIAGRTRSFGQWVDYLAYRLHFKHIGTDSKNNMNPVGYYLKTNPSLMKFINDKLSDVNCIKNKTIHRIVSEITATGTSMEKIQAVTLVRAVKMFGLE